AIEVSAGNTSIPSGAGSFYVGSSPVAIPKAQAFTVKNAGTAPLILQEPIALPAGFTLVSSFGSTTLAPGATTTFAVALNAAAAGRVGGKLSFQNSDATKSPFNFTLVGDATAPQGLQYVDNGGVGFATTGTWQSIPGGFQGDCAAAPGGAGNTATWT